MFCLADAWSANRPSAPRPRPKHVDQFHPHRDLPTRQTKKKIPPRSFFRWAQQSCRQIRGCSTSGSPHPSFSRATDPFMAADPQRPRPLHLGQCGSRPATRWRRSGYRRSLTLCHALPPCLLLRLRWPDASSTPADMFEEGARDKLSNLL
uniref:Uncharacterized protein n=1 Tax=Triticum urartu TaxID=4572 RepID=A0A8R7R8R6_TRIUA